MSLDIMYTGHGPGNKCKSIMLYNDVTELVYALYGSQDMVIANRILGTQITDAK